jgi:hypothetical protein
MFTAYSNESEHLEQKQLTASLCLAAEGPIPWGEPGDHKAAFNGCSSEKEGKRLETELFQVDVRSHYLGGSRETRNALIALGLSPERLKAFLDEATQSSRPVRVEFRPIWDLLKTRAENSEDRRRALNLEAYFAGFRGYPCDYRKAKETVLQRFAPAPAGADTESPFICERPCDGCQNDDDCHLGGAGSVCYCYGDSCINTIDGRPEVQYGQTGSYNQGINNSCGYDFLSCSCDGSGTKWKTTWPKPGSCR